MTRLQEAHVVFVKPGDVTVAAVMQEVGRMRLVAIGGH